MEFISNKLEEESKKDNENNMLMMELIKSLSKSNEEMVGAIKKLADKLDKWIEIYFVYIK